MLFSYGKMAGKKEAACVCLLLHLSEQHVNSFYRIGCVLSPCKIPPFMSVLMDLSEVKGVRVCWKEQAGFKLQDPIKTKSRLDKLIRNKRSRS